MEEGINKGFETSTVLHRDLCDMLKEDDQRWVLLYKNHRYLRRAFEDFRIIMLNRYGRPTTSVHDSEELIIANF
jgi:hypothetical protein